MEKFCARLGMKASKEVKRVRDILKKGNTVSSFRCLECGKLVLSTLVQGRMHTCHLCGG